MFTCKKATRAERVSKSLFTTHGDSSGWIVCCLLCTRTGRRPAIPRQIVPVTLQECHNISNGNGEAPVGIADVLSRVLLLLFVQRITLLIILSLMGEVQVGCLAWMLRTSGFVYGNRGWNLSCSMCATSQTLLTDLAAECLFLELYSIKSEMGQFLQVMPEWEFYWLEDDGWSCTIKNDPFQSQGRGFKKHDSHGSVAPARRHLIYYFSFIVWFLSDQCNSYGMKNSTCKGKKVLHYKGGNVPVTSQ